MTKEQKIYCQIGQAVCDTLKFLGLCSVITGFWSIANILANLI